MHCTFRDDKKKFLLEGVSWIKLDFGEYKGVDDAGSFLQTINFSRIIYLAGEMSNHQNDVVGFSHFSDYFTRNISTPIWFLKSLLLDKDFEVRCTFSYLSSRASEYGSNDFCYGAGKAALENVIKSFSLLNLPNLDFKVIVSGLIKRSGMYEEMLPQVIDSHMNRSNGQLLDAKEAASQIWAISAIQNSTSSFEKFKIGPDY